LLGSGTAGVWLYLFPRPFSGPLAPRRLPWLALAYALSNLIAFWVYQQVPLTVAGLRDGLSAVEIGWLIFIYAELTIPFIFAGATIVLILRHYQQQAGRLYFADLVGASIGCLLSVVALNLLGGASLLLTSVLAALGAFVLSWSGGTRRAQWVTGTVAAVGVIALGWQITSPWMTLRLQQTYLDKQPIYERWNAFSRISVYDDNWLIPFGWGISQRYFDAPRSDPGHFTILIDEKAGTPIQRHVVQDGMDVWEPVDFLAYDVTALPYYLRDEAKVFIVGPGGGRDVLTALLFNAQQIIGVELNPIVVDLVKNQYAEYTGNIYNRDNVTIHVDDARTYLAANPGQFDIIQASLIDTFAATSAGAFALSENGIYTVEAFEEYYDHLKDDGLVNFSRWYFGEGPAETLRLVSVAVQAWENKGVTDVGQHLVVLANLKPDRIVTEGLAGMLLKKTPFTEAELATVNAEAERLDFAVLYAPGSTASNTIADFVRAADRSAFIQSYPLDISPSTDNRPFFFNVVRLNDLNNRAFTKSGIYGFGAEAARTLLITLGIAMGMSLVLIVLPLSIGRGRRALRQQHALTYIGYYALLGLGFILVEIPMLQKMSLYMGNPTYALVVILFSLLLFSGIGSYLSQRVPEQHILRSIRLSLSLLIVLVLAYALVLSPILQATQGLRIELRALVVCLLLLPAGLLMGRPFPLGLRYVHSAGAEQVMPWLWAANGTLSVVGTVLATIMAMNLGFAAVFISGVLAYALALGLTLVFVRRRRTQSQSPLAGELQPEMI
jgi:SAM-dependent methyltransferase